MRRVKTSLVEGGSRVRRGVNGRIVANTGVGSRAAWASPLLVSVSTITGQTACHGHVRAMWGWAGTGRVCRRAVRGRGGSPNRILMIVAAGLADMVRGGFVAGIRASHVVDRNRCSGIRWKTFKWNRRNNTSSRRNASWINIMAHIDRLDRRPLRISRGTRARRATWRGQTVV